MKKFLLAAAIAASFTAPLAAQAQEQEPHPKSVAYEY